MINSLNNKNLVINQLQQNINKYYNNVCVEHHYDVLLDCLQMFTKVYKMFDLIKGKNSLFVF